MTPGDAPRTGHEGEAAADVAKYDLAVEVRGAKLTCAHVVA